MNVTTLNTTTLDGNVIIKKGGGGTPTPPSGGESTIEYLDVSGLEESQIYLKNAIVALANMVKGQNDEGTFLGIPLIGIQLLFGVANNARTVIAVAIDFLQIIRAKVGNDVVEISINQAIFALADGVTQAEIDAIPRITEAEFYDLNA